MYSKLEAAVRGIITYFSSDYSIVGIIKRQSVLSIGIGSYHSCVFWNYSGSCFSSCSYIFQTFWFFKGRTSHFRTSADKTSRDYTRITPIIITDTIGKINFCACTERILFDGYSDGIQEFCRERNGRILCNIEEYSNNNKENNHEGPKKIFHTKQLKN